jgi:hypothetical protein
MPVSSLNVLSARLRGTGRARGERGIVQLSVEQFFNVKRPTFASLLQVSSSRPVLCAIRFSLER